jgi:hypothetical protein
MPVVVPRLRLVAASMWTVSLWTVGVAAATLSAVIDDRAQFGAIVSVLFRNVAYLAMLCGLATLVLTGRDAALEAGRRRTIRIIAVLMLVCVGVYFALQPMMAALRETVMSPEARKQFGMLHGVSMLAYLVQAILGVVLVLKSLPPRSKKGTAP